MNAYFTQNRVISMLVALAFLSLIMAFTAQYVFGLEPCILCLWQRVPYALVIAFGFLHFAHKKQFITLNIFGISLMAGAAIAAFHVGVEQHWWQGTDSCAIDLSTTDPEALRAQIMNAPRARCDEVAWSLFGISMAGYNVVYSLILGSASLYFAQKKTPELQGGSQSGGF